MVQPKDKEESLQGDDYLWPFAVIRDTLLRPEVESVIPGPKVKLLLKHHMKALQKPWQPFKPAAAEARTALQADTVTIPGTDVKFDVDAGSRNIAKRFSDEAGLNEVEAFGMWRSYVVHSVEEPTPAPGQSEEDALLDRLMLWYEEELLAVPQIVTALYMPAESMGWENVAADLKKDILGDQAAYIESLFRAFSNIAQRTLDLDRAGRLLYWATLQLRQQETLLDLLFLLLYQFTTRPAAVSEGLIKGSVLSSFGMSQANGDVWEEDAECQRIQLRIRDLVLVIAVESLCLAQIVSPEAEEEGDRFGATLLHNRDRIHAVHQFIMDQSEDLEQVPDANEIVFPYEPLPILCLAWAIVLHSLPANFQPPSGDYFKLDTNEMEADDPLMDHAVASRALRLSSGLFPWLETILEGPLFNAAKDVFSGDLASDMAALRRSPFKDLLIGLSELIHIEKIVDRPGLCRSWELLFGGGPPECSTSLANNYWGVDFPYEQRRAILDMSRFPREPSYLPRVLAALSGASADGLSSLSAASNFDTISEVFDYVHSLPFVTHITPPSTFVVAGREENLLAVEASVDFELPGGVKIPRRTRGLVLSGPDDVSTVVSWRFHQSAWPLLIEILRGASGLSPAKASIEGARKLSLADLGVQGQLPQILESGLQLLRCVMRSPTVTLMLVNECSGPQERFAGQGLLELTLSVVSDRSTEDIVPAQYAIDILQSLLLTGSDEIWLAFRASGFFDSHSRRQSSVAALIQTDAMRGQHSLTVALLRLVSSLASANSGDPHVVRAAVKLVFTNVWSQFSGWRYRDAARRYEIAGLLLNIFDLVLRHPIGDDGQSPSPAASYLIESFITSASPLTYKVIVDVFTQARPLATKLLQQRRWSDTATVYDTFDRASSFLATLVRLSPSLQISASALPYSVFAQTVVRSNGDKIQLIDHLFDLTSEQSLNVASLRLVMRLLKVYFETSSHDQARPSLAGMLRDVGSTASKLADVAFTSGLGDIKPDAWALLAVIIATQPGCAAFCVGKAKKEKVDGPLEQAVREMLEWKKLVAHGPRALASVLGYCQSVLESPSVYRSVAALRKDEGFWQAVHDIAVKNVPRPPMWSDHIATDVQTYSYAVQAKANATALLAAELALVAESGDGQALETKAQSVVLSMFRNSALLQESALAAIYTSCEPEMHATEDALLASCGVQLVRLRTICLADERDFGVQYLYDGTPVIFNNSERQAEVNRSLAILNLNWSQLDANVALTKAFRALAEVALTWTEGDSLAAKAALRAGRAVATELADENRGGDVMLAIQTERLSILATLLETALDADNEVTEPELAKELAGSVRKIVESSLFSPIMSLRHPELPPIHRPALRVLLQLSQAKTGAAEDELRAVLFDSGATFALEAADVLMDNMVRQGQQDLAVEQDLGLVVALLCEMSRVSTSMSVWIDKLQQVNLIARSLQVVVRARPVNGVMPTHLHTILLFHLAIASSGPTAEKLAVSGVMPAYADNAVALAAEAGDIDAAAPRDSLQAAWCSMLLVVKALLSSLPNAASFARSDVVPWARVVMPQLVRALAWDGETSLSRAGIDELALAVDVFYGLASALRSPPTGTGSTAASLFAEFAPSAVDFLRGVRYALSHPHRFCALIVPSTEEEQAALEKELIAIEGKEDVNLLDATKLPFVAERTANLLQVTRVTLMTLVIFTRAWDVLAGEADAKPEWLLPFDDERLLSASNDPLGVVNDLYGSLMSMAGKDAMGSDAGPRGVAAQAAEAAVLLSLTQLLARRALAPANENGGGNSGNSGDGDAMDVDVGGGKRRLSVSLAGAAGAAGRAGQVRRELEADVRGMLPEDATGMLGVLRGVAEREFAEQ